MATRTRHPQVLAFERVPGFDCVVELFDRKGPRVVTTRAAPNRLLQPELTGVRVVVTSLALP
jgi:hypothetical protein